ncbi:cation:proton antiporter [Azospirillum rugosum]|uniref:CPA1 family monovalent cation:H+ antiporter n=1 Tax=Azospirillum rugosum TaxID=416170 RepID=A0ABS4SDC9_9PROT|nr:cation:proton antiporter [Azospirillum rugosum]MBP2290502.1 CPA1 family monovalent cation:H+ antiporter [Azospirillum rugosum]MDQ0525390.1 CPA1 family monovalent cation:H+ antiporter [Azospirillum rugosum]
MHDIVIYVLGVSGLLALVSFLPPLAARLQVPYTVLLAAVGVALGAVIQSFAGVQGAGPVHDFLNSLAGLDVSSEVLLYIFLPVLLFETALAVDVRRLFDDIGPILVLAVVAVFVCTFAIGFALSLFTSMGLVACLLLGSILATTDPAAVVGVFRDLGAPRRLTMLVEGESLLNDAAAIALFTLLLGMLTSRTHGGAMEAATEFLRDFAGGVLTGYVCGRVACFLVEPVRDQPMAEITLTVALAYLTYVLAEHYVGASGVVAVVTSALVVGSVGRTRISPATWGALEHVWRQLGFWANSLIFLMTAILVPRLLLGIGWVDVGLLAVVVVAATAARALVLFGLLPLLSATGLGQQVSHSYKAVMLWGGLRGAVSLTLALAVTENGRLPERVQSFVAVIVTGFVFYTLFVNGTTLRALIRLLKLDQLSPVEHAMRNRALALSLASIRERVENVARHYEVDEAATEAVVSQYADRLGAIDREREAELPISNEDRVTIGLAILVNREEELYFAHFKEGVLSRGVAELLTARSARLLDAVRAQGRAGYRAFEEPFIAFTPWMRVASLLHRRLGWRAPLARRLAFRFEILVGVRTVQRELLDFTQTKIAQVLGQDVSCEMEGMLAVRLAMVEQALAAMKLQYPDYALMLQSRYVGRAALRLEEADFRALHAESIISAEVLTDLERDLDTRRRALERLPKLDLRLDLMDLVGRVRFFDGLEEGRLRGITTLLKPRLALPGETIVRRGERGDAMFFIASGAVEVLVPGLAEPVKLGTGDVFGEMALLTRQRRNADVRALGYCQMLVLDAKDFRQLMRRDTELRAHFQALAEARRNALKPKPPADRAPAADQAVAAPADAGEPAVEAAPQGAGAQG